MTTVYDICGTDQILIKKLIQTFLKKIPLIIQNFDIYMESKDIDNIFKTAHAARSSLSVIQVPKLNEILIIIEKIAQDTYSEVFLKELINDAKKIYTDVQHVLNEAFSENQ